MWNFFQFATGVRAKRLFPGQKPGDSGQSTEKEGKNEGREPAYFILEGIRFLPFSVRNSPSPHTTTCLRNIDWLCSTGEISRGAAKASRRLRPGVDHA
jgi:hypothetical protein